MSKENPFIFSERMQMIAREFTSEEMSRIRIDLIPDIDEFVYGRKVGYDIREIRLSQELEDISGTKLRKNK